MDVVLGDYFSTESDWTNEIKHNISRTDNPKAIIFRMFFFSVLESERWQHRVIYIIRILIGIAGIRRQTSIHIIIILSTVFRIRHNS